MFRTQDHAQRAEEASDRVEARIRQTAQVGDIGEHTIDGDANQPSLTPLRCVRGSVRSPCGSLPLRELEALAGALAAVLLAFLHAAVASEKAGVAESLGHVDDGLVAVGALRLAGQAEHGL